MIRSLALWGVSLACLALPELLGWRADIDLPQERAFATEGYPPEMVAAAKLTEKRCTRCHNLKRITRAKYRGDEWASVVDVMIKKPRARTTAAEGRTIKGFLAFHSTRESAGAAPKNDKKSEAFFPRRRFARLAERSIPFDSKFPLTFELESYEVVVSKLEAETRPESPSVTLRVTFEGEKVELRSGLDAEGVRELKDHVVHEWSVGPKNYRLLLAVDLPGDAQARAATLALLIDRSPEERVKVGSLVSFEKQVLPILEESCEICHDSEGEADLDLRSYATLMKGGKSGLVVAAGNPGESLIWKRLTAEIKPLMPEGGDQLPPGELDLVKRWIAEGAMNN